MFNYGNIQYDDGEYINLYTLYNINNSFGPIGFKKACSRYSFTDYKKTFAESVIEDVNDIQLFDSLSLHHMIQPDIYFAAFTCCRPIFDRCGQQERERKVSYIRELAQPSASNVKNGFFDLLKLPQSYSDVQKDGLYLCDVMNSFNLGVLAYLALPSYLASVCSGGTIYGDNAFSDLWNLSFKTIHQGLSTQVPEIRSFDDYFMMYLKGRIPNNVDIFMSLYGLSCALSLLISVLNDNGYDSVKSVFSRECLLSVTPALVKLFDLLKNNGSISSIFSFSFNIYDALSFDNNFFDLYSYFPGISNTDCCENLDSILKLIEILSPISFNHIFEDYPCIAVRNQIFYGLIDAFSLKEAFNIDSGMEFKYLI